MKRLLAPNFRAHSITDLSPVLLKERGIRGLILDLDGNLVGYRGESVTPDVTAWIANMLAEGIRICIVSNPGRKNTLALIAVQLGLTAFRGVLPKPLPRAFAEARAYLDLEYGEIAMVGDQLLTDVLGGNLLSMLTVWVDVVPGEREGVITRNFNRRIEWLYKRSVLKIGKNISPYFS